MAVVVADRAALHRRIVLFLLVISALALLTITPTASAASTLFVNNGVACDDATADSTATPYCTIQAAVQDADDGDTIQIAAGTYGASSGNYVVDTSGVDLTLQGAGRDLTYIDGGNVRGGVQSDGGNLVLRDLTIKSGHRGGSGGGILFMNATTLTLEDVTLANNNSAASGGGLYFNASNATITFTRVIADANTSTTGVGTLTGGAIDGFGSEAALVIGDSLFTANQAGSHGGAIVVGIGVAVTVTNSTFRANLAGGDGGAIDSRSEFTNRSIVISDSLFEENEAGGSGGAISVNAAPIEVSRSTFLDNTADVTGGAVNDASENAGTFSNVTVVGNTATTNNGGGLRTSGVISNSTVVGNHSGQSGGGIVTSGWAGGPIVRNSIIAGNTASSEGPDCKAVVSGGYNLIEDVAGCIDSGDTTGNITGLDPMLSPPGDNGGPTPTMALAPASPARNAGHPAVPGSGGSACAETDQRGFTRVPDNDCDMGAYELYECNGLAATLVGTDGPDTLVGTHGDDVIVGLGGNDTITGRMGRDTICGGAGNDDINGNDGSDWIFGEGGHDTLRGSKGNDRIYGGNGNDTIYGGVGKDKEWGEGGDDTLYGNKGRDTLRGGPGTDTLDGGPGIDTCLTGETLIAC